MQFFILSPYKIEALEYTQPEFVADDLLAAIQSGQTLIATTEEHFYTLKEAHPKLTYFYKVNLDKFCPLSIAPERRISLVAG